MVEYAIDLALSYVIAVIDVAAILIPLRGHTSATTSVVFAEKDTVIVVLLVVAGIIGVAIAGVFSLIPTLRWYAAGQEPTTAQREVAMRLAGRQTAILLAAWGLAGTIFVLLNLDGGAALLLPMVLGVVLGGPAAAGTGMLLAQRTLRPIMGAATRGLEPRLAVPGVFARLVMLWFLVSALPIGVIATLVVLRTYGWLIQKSASLDVPILVVSLAALLLGLPTMILTSRSISDPIGEVVDAMAQVERGNIDTTVGAYERSQIGRLQTGFNRMVAGLAERDRLRDLFGRHVGADVAQRAIEEGASLSGDVVEAAVLFIDLVGSTQLAESRPPQEVADVLNDFFRIVVGAVDEHSGLINKFAGDAALAIFGAPLRTGEPSSAALATARTLGTQLRRLPVDFGIGVSAGRVFAGNIGAENRYEYTVIGDAVNEAARLADLAKTSDRRILCSAAAIDRADETERGHWAQCYSTVLRGRSEATHVSAPAGPA
ncbi:MAG: adenylate/guanylate cyclase domain-containing protein [Actinomycetota bacterium]|uniref:Adenylate/guanylate cyclase domain-containing protein n=1 Tax=Mycobacterium lentiflavum TaxID=141349 RepID=A0ABY3V6K9_MYCLN|nr:adenylate/guanylate cyclase domain-containing protein [Mycobacterium lentiflavum]MEE3063499.1 adenylate/guanylate cyclase domain-containing protein [Actinomycetota bacterium]ULP45260.1 adenylate/guanylate cyclase domain-containing protein [Mycobacterium lentiflavum]